MWITGSGCSTLRKFEGQEEGANINVTILKTQQVLVPLPEMPTANGHCYRFTHPASKRLPDSFLFLGPQLQRHWEVMRGCSLSPAAEGTCAAWGGHLTILSCSARFRHGCQQVAEVGEEKSGKNQPRKDRQTCEAGGLATKDGKWGDLYFKTRSTLYTGRKTEMN